MAFVSDARRHRASQVARRIRAIERGATVVRPKADAHVPRLLVRAAPFVTSALDLLFAAIGLWIADTAQALRLVTGALAIETTRIEWNADRPARPLAAALGGRVATIVPANLPGSGRAAELIASVAGPRAAVIHRAACLPRIATGPSVTNRVPGRAAQLFPIACAMAAGVVAAFGIIW